MSEWRELQNLLMEQVKGDEFISEHKKRINRTARELPEEEKLEHLQECCTDEIFGWALQEHREAFFIEAIEALAYDSLKAHPDETLKALKEAVELIAAQESEYSPISDRMLAYKTASPQELPRVDIEKGRIAQMILKVVLPGYQKNPNAALDALNTACQDLLAVEYTLETKDRQKHWDIIPVTVNPLALELSATKAMDIICEQLEMHTPTIDFSDALESIRTMAARIDEIQDPKTRELHELLAETAEVIEEIAPNKSSKFIPKESVKFQSLLISLDIRELVKEGTITNPEAIRYRKILYKAQESSSLSAFSEMRNIVSRLRGKEDTEISIHPTLIRLEKELGIEPERYRG